MRSALKTAVALLSLPVAAMAAAAGGTAAGPQVGERIPAFTAPDQAGRQRTLADLSGPNGLLLLFHRSADW